MTSPKGRLVVAATLISFTGVFAELAAVSGEKTALYRLVYALPVLGVAFLIGRRSGRRFRLVPIVCVVGLADGGAILLYHLAIEQSGVAIPTLIVNLHIVVAAVGGSSVFGDRLTVRHWAGIATALLGIVIIADPFDTSSTSPIHGVLLAGGAATLVGGYFLGLRHIRTRRPDLGTLDVVASVISATLVVNLVAAVLAGQVAPPTSWESNVWLLSLAVGTTVLATWLIVSSIDQMASATSGAILLLQPVLAFVWGVAFFDEVSAVPQLIGFGIALSGIAILTLASTPQRGNAIAPRLVGTRLSATTSRSRSSSFEAKD